VKKRLLSIRFILFSELKKSGNHCCYINHASWRFGEIALEENRAQRQKRKSNSELDQKEQKGESESRSIISQEGIYRKAKDHCEEEIQDCCREE
jgi:hypothetical protein